VYIWGKFFGVGGVSALYIYKLSSTRREENWVYMLHGMEVEVEVSIGRLYILLKLYIYIQADSQWMRLRSTDLAHQDTKEQRTPRFLSVMSCHAMSHALFFFPCLLYTTYCYQIRIEYSQLWERERETRTHTQKEREKQFAPRQSNHNHIPIHTSLKP